MTFTIMDVDPHAADMHVWYLDHHPGHAANMVPDALLYRAVVDGARLLSTAWARAIPDSHLTDWYPPTPEVVPYTPPDELSALVTKLHGQRVYNPIQNPSGSTASLLTWLAASAQNYTWLWRYTFQLTHLYCVVSGKPHGALPVVWALEFVPPLPDEPATEAPTVVRTTVYVHEDGEEYVDAVASYREYLLKHKQHMLQWTKREAPSWSQK